MLQNFHRPPDRFQTCLKDRLIRKGQTELSCTEWVFGISTAPAGSSGARLLPDNEALYGICFRNNSYIYGDLNHLVSAAMSIWAVELRSPEDFGHKSAISDKKQKQIIYIKISLPELILGSSGSFPSP